MKVAITSRGANLGAELDPRFGRARFFVVVDTETDRSTVHDNKGNLNALGYAGIKAAEAVLRLGAHAVITGNVGPKALATLKAGNVKVCVGATGQVRQALEQFSAGSSSVSGSQLWKDIGCRRSICNASRLQTNRKGGDHNAGR